MEFIPLLALVHTIGAAIGTFYTTYAEAFYTLAASDGVVDKHERKYLRHLFHALRIGMALVLLSGLALIVLEYLVPDAPQAVLTAPFWALQTITLVIVLQGYFLAKREEPWWLASAAILVGWWVLLFIDLGYFNTAGYLPIIVVYVIVTLLVAGVLGYLRTLLWKPQT